MFLILLSYNENVYKHVMCITQILCLSIFFFHALKISNILQCLWNAFRISTRLLLIGLPKQLQSLDRKFYKPPQRHNKLELHRLLKESLWASQCEQECACLNFVHLHRRWYAREINLLDLHSQRNLLPLYVAVRMQRGASPLKDAVKVVKIV